MNTEMQEHPIAFDEEMLFPGKVAHSLDEIIEDLEKVVFGEFVVLFIKEMKSYAKHTRERSEDGHRAAHP